ncbi:MAG: hypothetical protein ACRD0D_03720 [Acidimicrobiales bacterium]
MTYDDQPRDASATAAQAGGWPAHLYPDGGPVAHLHPPSATCDHSRRTDLGDPGDPDDDGGDEVATTVVAGLRAHGPGALGRPGPLVEHLTDEATGRGLGAVAVRRAVVAELSGFAGPSWAAEAAQLTSSHMREVAADVADDAADVRALLEPISPALADWWAVADRLEWRDLGPDEGDPPAAEILDVPGDIYLWALDRDVLSARRRGALLVPAEFSPALAAAAWTVGESAEDYARTQRRTSSAAHRLGAPDKREGP